MSVVTRPGWKVDDPNKSSDVLVATLPSRTLPGTTSISGSQSNVLTKINISNGNYDVYQPGVGGDVLIYSRNASNNKLIIRDQALFNQRFNQNTAEGKRNFEALDKSIRLATLDNAQLNTGTDPLRNQNFEKIKNYSTYKSIANGAKPGERIAPPGGSNPQQSGDTKPANENAASKEEADKLAAESKTSKENTRNIYDKPFVKYPENLNLKYQDCIKFTVIEYKASGQKSATTPGGVSDANRTFGTGRTILTSIILPIPGGISDSNSVDWQGDTLSEIQQIGSQIAAGLISGGAESGEQATKSGLQKAAPGGNTQGIESIITSKFAGKAVGANNLQQRLFGTIVNPNLELLFNAPNLREFSFLFRLSPRSPSEAKIVRKIIRYFKQAMSVKRTKSSLLLKTPHTFLISYQSENKAHPYLNRFKECALTNCSVNYAPDQTYMTFGGGLDDRSMTAYELQLNFQELEPIFDDDYFGIDENKDTAIGY